MSLSEKLSIIANNTSKVYNAGYKKGLAESGGGSSSGNNELVWVEDDSPVIYEKRCYQNASVIMHITENGTCRYRKNGTNGTATKWQYSNIQQFIGAHGANTSDVFAVVQAEIINDENNIITEIGTYTFAQMRNLKRVKIPETIKVINAKAFTYCISLKSIKIPDSVTTFYANAFAHCYSLETFEFPPQVTTVPEGMFSNCTCLKEVIGLDRMISLETSAFEFCLLLPSITLGERLDSIGNNAFRYCSNLESVKFLGIPTGTISSGIFTGCLKLTNIYVPWSEGEVANAPWGATNATIHYNTTYDADGNPII